MFAEIDTDGDGFITREEVIVYITKQGGTEEQANGTFDQLDTDKDGKVSKEEFRFRGILACGMFADIDTDGDGGLTRGEIAYHNGGAGLHATRV